MLVSVLNDSNCTRKVRFIAFPTHIITLYTSIHTSIFLGHFEEKRNALITPQI